MQYLVLDSALCYYKWMLTKIFLFCFVFVWPSLLLAKRCDDLTVEMRTEEVINNPMLLEPLFWNNGKDLRQQVRKLDLTKVENPIQYENEMARLVEAGGEGKYVDVYQSTQQGRDTIKMQSVGKGIEVTKAPSDPIYGDVFTQSFNKLKKSNVRIVVKLNQQKLMGITIEGASLSTIRRGQPNAKGILFINPLHMGNALMRHEMQHMEDFILSPASLNKTMPPLPESLRSAIKKLVRDGKGSLTGSERFRIVSAYRLLIDATEIRASEQTFRRLFTRQGLRELFFSPVKKQELFFHLAEFANLGMRYSQHIFHSVWVNPATPRTAFIALKLGTWAAIYKWVFM